MLKVTSSLYTWIYFCFDTLRTTQHFSWGERSTHFVAPCMVFFSFFLFGCNFQFYKKIKNKKKIKNLEFECRRVISLILISCDGMNNAKLVILFVILRLFHEEHNWKLLSTIARLADGWMLDMHGSWTS